LIIFTNKKRIYLMIAALIAMIQLSMSSAIPVQPCPELDQRALELGPAVDFAGGQIDRPPAGGLPIGLFYNGRGFALKNHESHDLMVTVVNLMPPDPLRVQGLLASNKSIDEIRDEINAMQDKSIYRGFIKLDEMVYPLIDITSSPSGGDSISLYAHVVEPALDLTISNETSIAGNLEVTIVPREGHMVGNGKLIMNRGPNTGTYDIMLDGQPMEPGGRDGAYPDSRIIVAD
jgi:hypothetical protein